ERSDADNREQPGATTARDCEQWTECGTRDRGEHSECRKQVAHLRYRVPPHHDEPSHRQQHTGQLATTTHEKCERREQKGRSRSVLPAIEAVSVQEQVD